MRLLGPSGMVQALIAERQAIARHGLSTLGVAALGFSASVAFATSVAALMM